MSYRETENGHVWFRYNAMLCCKVCGIVRRGDGKNKPCPGPVSIQLREGVK